MDAIFRRELGPGGVDLPSSSADTKKGVVFSRHWGGDVASPENPEKAVRLAWNVEAAAGTYEIWALYAADAPKPVRIEVNGQPVVEQALSETTFGEKPSFLTWVRQGVFSVGKSKFEVALASSGNSFGFVKGLRLVATEPGTAIAPSGTPSSFREPSKLERSDLVRALAPTIRTLLARGVATAAVTDALSALVEGIRRDLNDPQARQGFRGPLNGQIIRQKIFTGLDKLFRFDAFVETGSYLGTTTEMFATYERPVFSCENQPSYFYRAAARCAPFKGVTLTLEDSRTFLKEFTAAHAASFTIPFIYLDAHWYDDLPLPEEIEIVAQAFPNFVIMVDDFQHPYFAYGYDKYPTGIELTLDYLLPRLTMRDQLEFLFPVHPEHLETGPRRGTLVVVPKGLAPRILGSEVPLAPSSAFGLPQS
jgi:hypothetical protein